VPRAVAPPSVERAAVPAGPLTPPPAFLALLRGRLTRRATADGVVYVLDLRQRRYAGLGFDRLTVRDPAADGWPHHGRTTKDEAEAAAWLQCRYASWIFGLVGLGRSTPDAADLTVREAAQIYVDGLAAAHAGRNADGASTARTQARATRTTLTVAGSVAGVPRGKQSRVSLIRRHVIPTLGPRILTTLDRAAVAQAADAIVVRKRSGSGTRRAEAGADGTKRNFLAAMMAIWHASFPHAPAPFAGARVAAPAIVAGVSAEVTAFDEELPLGDEHNGALNAEQLFRVLVAAMYLDQAAMARPNIRGAMVPNTPHAIALQAGLGLRISELCNVRHGHIYGAGYAVVHNAKVQQVGVERRVVPTPVTLDPWVAELRAAEGPALHPNHFAIRSDPRAGGLRPAAPTTIARRIATALALAGVKVEGKATHGMRATFASHADACPHLDAKMVKRYLGHHRVYGTSTDKYVRQLIALMRPEHRHILTLPHPDAVRAALATFTPAPRPPRRRAPWPRSRAAREARRTRLPRVPLGTSLDAPDDGAAADGLGPAR
jgi:integrase